MSTLGRETAADVAIVGAGMVGATLACALAQRGLRVALVESGELAWPPAPFDAGAGVDLRVSAVSVASEQIFRSLGFWDNLAARRVSPYREMRVWDATGPGSIHFDCAEIPWPHLGHIVENHLIRDAALERLYGVGSAEVHGGVAVTALEMERRRARLGLSDGREVTAPLVVAADGADSRLRELAGLETVGYGYAQRAVVAHVETQLGHDETARQRFIPSGPLALLPLADGRCSIVWSTSPGHAGELTGLDDDRFCAAVTDASDAVLGGIRSASPRAAFPLRVRLATRYAAERVALVGDAAHAVHPLAGQGANLGFLDAAALAEVLSEAVAEGRDPGEARVLQRYERWRKGQNMLMAGVLDGFKHLFGNDNALLRPLRNRGMSLVDRLTPIKHGIVERAMGLAGDLPSMARADVSDD